MKPFAVYTVHESIDEYGRNGRLIGQTLDRNLAHEMAKGRGAYGNGNIVVDFYIEGEPGVYYKLLGNPQPANLDTQTLKESDEVRREVFKNISPKARKALGL